MMLSDTDLPLIHHGTQIPEKWPSTRLTCVRFDPFAHFFSHRIHLPEHKHRILARRNQLLRRIGKLQRSYFVAEIGGETNEMLKAEESD